MKSGNKQSPSKLKQRFTFGHWEVGKGKFCSREVVQAADGSMRVGQPAYIKSLDFVPLGKLRKEQSGGGNVNEKTAMRSALGALGYQARESRLDLSGPVSFLQSRFNKAQMSNIQETEWSSWPRLTQSLYAKFLWIKSVFVSYGRCQWWTGYVIMFAGRALLKGMAAPVALVSWRSHRVKRVAASASAAEAIAQGDWVRAL